MHRLMQLAYFFAVLYFGQTVKLNDRSQKTFSYPQVLKGHIPHKTYCSVSFHRVISQNGTVKAFGVVFTSSDFQFEVTGHWEQPCDLLM